MPPSVHPPALITLRHLCTSLTALGGLTVLCTIWPERLAGTFTDLSQYRILTDLYWWLALTGNNMMHAWYVRTYVHACMLHIAIVQIILAT